ncbi:ankyrin [Mytilinidion resinicola]|uniref:Ankyrin n=1 Tax=Mytilinidion resinicola TaxID=574789 RepID=A0A6A6YDP8_9PEZI|nr:ankyrin [Mytilinidion resinicola]KAF2806952.1 ankyrin [Mytilinidion resinicola]
MATQASTTAITHSPTATTIGGNGITPIGSLQSQSSWKTFKSKVSISERTSSQLGWAIALFSVILTVVALSPTFKSLTASQKALELAEWTALKDYIEDCKSELAAGVESRACQRAIAAQLPPPPYVKLGVVERIRRSLFNHDPVNPRSSTVDTVTNIPRTLEWLVFLLVLLTIAVFLFLSFESNRSRVRQRAQLDPTIDEEYESRSDDSPITLYVSYGDQTGSSRPLHQSNASALRQRKPPRPKGPSYRHASLEEALRVEDLLEIQLRLSHGEDITRHWPYLIYSLAISSPATRSDSRRLDIARLCLKHGADVNALKGWNGQSALMIAIHFGNVAVATLLIEHGADVCHAPPGSGSGGPALHRCVRLAVTGSIREALELTQLLFDYGADANQTSRLGETVMHEVLMEAWFNRDVTDKILTCKEIAMMLVKNGAVMPKTIKERYVKGNPLYEVVEAEVQEREARKRPLPWP